MSSRRLVGCIDVEIVGSGASIRSPGRGGALVIDAAGLADLRVAFDWIAERIAVVDDRRAPGWVQRNIVNDARWLAQEIYAISGHMPLVDVECPRDLYASFNEADARGWFRPMDGVEISLMRTRPGYSADRRPPELSELELRRRWRDFMSERDDK